MIVGGFNGSCNLLKVSQFLEETSCLTAFEVITVSKSCTFHSEHQTSQTLLHVSGASFLIPYLVMLLVVGLPAMLIELSAGQYARVGANKVFGRMVPAFKVTTKYNSFYL